MASASNSTVNSILPSPFAWCEVPAGEVTLSKGWSYNTLKPAVYGEGETFTVPAFAMAKYPVTNAQFAKFVEAGGYQQKQWWLEVGWQDKEAQNWTTPRFWHDPKVNGATYPVVGVTWYEAVAFCLWLSEVSGENIRLPTEQQWQRAAQGDDGRAYPWGNEWDGTKCNNAINMDDEGKLREVTAYEAAGNISPAGVVTMVGNIYEWCLTDYKTGSQELSSPNTRVVRGAAHYVGFEYGSRVNFRVDYRDRMSPRDDGSAQGFRIVRSF